MDYFALFFPHYLTQKMKHLLTYLYSRYMVATRTLQPGDIILREKAAVVGPSLEQSKPICVGCSAPLTR